MQALAHTVTAPGGRFCRASEASTNLSPMRPRVFSVHGGTKRLAGGGRSVRRFPERI
ncbi:MAG: hypothetical protein OJF47_001426 [Nitrospira sp.]|nr:MAG: hypothetical protein OJF47_001426 [Nitrospira sp.]